VFRILESYTEEPLQYILVGANVFKEYKNLQILIPLFNLNPLSDCWWPNLRWYTLSAAGRQFCEFQELWIKPECDPMRKVITLLFET